MSISRTLAHHVISHRSLPPDLQDWMRHLLLDYYAVTAGGVDRASAKAARSAFRVSGQPDGIRSAQLHGVEAWAAPEEAALINGTTAHGLELDDTHEEASLHPAVTIFPAVLAEADAHEYTCEEVLLAAALGYDVMCSIGVLLGASESYRRGFHPTGVAGVLGSAAAVCSLLGLDEERTTHALGLAANMASGSLEFLSDGSWTKRLNAGQAAANGLRAARLASTGFTAPNQAIEGRDGFLHQYGNGMVEGRQLKLEFGRGALDTSIKFYPCCRYMHGNIDLLRSIYVEFPGLEIDDIESIDTAVIGAGAALVSEPRERKLVVKTPVDAQFNMPFGAAVALATGDATVAQFEDAPQVAQDLMPWLEKVNCYESDILESAYPARWQAEVTVRLKNGQLIIRRADAFRGSPRARATRMELEQKAARLLSHDAARQLTDCIFGTNPGRPFSEQISGPIGRIVRLAPRSVHEAKPEQAAQRV